MIRLSIIVPIYNSEETLLKCLESIPKRDDIELILFDDCSTDMSLDILKSWINENNNLFANIILKINNENKGVGYVKSVAYELVNGEYVSTIDSDDYVYTSNYSKIIDNLYDNHYDNEILILDHDDNSKVITRSNSCNATWRYFIKIKFLRDNDLKINPIYRRAEDWFLMRDIEKYNPKFTRLNILAYHYNYPRAGSITWNYIHKDEK